MPASKKVITTNRGDVKNCTVEISNLVDGLEESDLLEIFDSVKDKVKKATVNSDGTAKLVFSTRSLVMVVLATITQNVNTWKPVVTSACFRLLMQ